MGGWAGVGALTPLPNFLLLFSTIHNIHFSNEQAFLEKVKYSVHQELILRKEVLLCVCATRLRGDLESDLECPWRADRCWSLATTLSNAAD